MVMVSWCDCLSQMAHVTLVMEKGPPEQHGLRIHCHRLRLASSVYTSHCYSEASELWPVKNGLWQGLSAQVTKLLMSRGIQRAGQTSSQLIMR